MNHEEMYDGQTEELSAELTAFDQYVAEVAKAQAEWTSRWPDACKCCHGWGGFMSRATRWQPADFDFCGALSEDACHRCGKGHALVENGDGFDAQPCRFCGWVAGEDGEPQV